MASKYPSRNRGLWLRFSNVPILPVLFASGVTVFNLTVAITPWTSDPPPIRNVPEDIFLHSGWAEQNYIGQGRYLGQVLNDPVLVGYPGVVSLGPVFFTETAPWEESTSRSAAPEITPALLGSLREKSQILLAEGSETECMRDGAPEEAPTSKWCRIEVLVHPDSPVSGTRVELHVLESPASGVLLVDDALLSEMLLTDVHD